MAFPNVLDPVPLGIVNTVAQHSGECLHMVVNMISLGKTAEENEKIHEDLKSAITQIDINTLDLKGEHNMVTFGMIRLNHYKVLKKLIEKMEHYVPSLKEAVVEDNIILPTGINIEVSQKKIPTVSQLYEKMDANDIATTGVEGEFSFRIDFPEGTPTEGIWNDLNEDMEKNKFTLIEHQWFPSKVIGIFRV